MCGENSNRQRVLFFAAGSSPRVRGKRIVGKTGFFLGRLIPACAGKTSVSEKCGSCAAAHPRVCGENVAWSSRAMMPSGSSPRVRGKPISTYRDLYNARLIPACAGKTQQRSSIWTTRTAHPRVCGENRQSPSWMDAAWGSSPRVRGKRAWWPRPSNHRRLIPACAGKTFPQRAEARSQWAHPRVCGENNNGLSKCTPVRGSSPRVRGKRRRSNRRRVVKGLIPACAGKTKEVLMEKNSKTAHPRVCGEN